MALRGSSYRRADVRLLINAGVHRDRHICEPAMAVYVQHRMGINPEFQGRPTTSFDLLNGGCGMLNAVQVTAALMAAGEVGVALVTASETDADRRSATGFPYAASGAAFLLDVSPRRGTGFGGFAVRTDESLADLATSAVLLDVPRGRLVLERKDGLEEAWLGLAREVTEESLAAEGLTREEIGLVVPAQISPGFLRRLPEAVGFPREKVADFTGRLPDTLSTSTALALHLARRGGGCPPGSRVLLLFLASGLTAGAAVLSL
jgi:3-oxoacyl-[acyl-carrier-protein] synthase-3